MNTEHAAMHVPVEKMKQSWSSRVDKDKEGIIVLLFLK
jgi:hypothetical protein